MTELALIPGYCVKDKPDERIKGSALFQSAISEYNLDCIQVPHQFKYIVPSEITTSLKTDYPNVVHEVCVANYITPDPTKQITLEHAKQLKLLLDVTGYWDIGDKHRNLIIQSNNKICLIDTEINGFSYNHDWGGYRGTRRGLRQAYQDLLSAPDKLTPNAREYLDKLAQYV